eukprot:SAG11_NODE_2720_length_3046_cov_40.638955_5_plen_328_part_01
MPRVPGTLEHTTAPRLEPGVLPGRSWRREKEVGGDGPRQVLPGAVPAAFESAAPTAAELKYRKPQAAAKYELDLGRLKSQKPWFAAAVRYWTAELGDSKEAQFFVFCRLSRQQISTQKGYAGKYVEWEVDFCGKQDPPLCPLPATRATALKYIGWQARKGTVRAGSLRQYIAAINCAHEDCGFDTPFDNSADQKAAINGMGLLQAEVGPEIVGGAERIYLPAGRVEHLLDYALGIDVECIALADREAVTAYRDAVSIVFNFADFGRGDTQAGMLERDVALDSATGPLYFRLRKQKKVPYVDSPQLNAIRHKKFRTQKVLFRAVPTEYS